MLVIPDVGSPIDRALNFSQPALVNGVPAPTPETPSIRTTTAIWQAPSLTKKMPPLKSFRLTKELVQQRVKDNIIIVTFGNYAFMDFILTWVKHLTDLELSNLLIGECLIFAAEVLLLFGLALFKYLCCFLKWKRKETSNLLIYFGMYVS